MVALENLLESKFNPMSILAKMKVMPSAVNKFNACVALFLSSLLSLSGVNAEGADELDLLQRGGAQGRLGRPPLRCASVLPLSVSSP